MCWRPSYSWIIVPSGVIIMGFLCREEGVLMWWGEQGEGKGSLQQPIEYGLHFSHAPPIRGLKKTQTPVQSKGRQLYVASPGLIHNEPYFGWKSFSSRNTLASGDWPSYNCISLCYWSLGLPKLKQATFDFFGIVQSVFCQHSALAALCKPNWPLLWPLVPSIHGTYSSEFITLQIRSLLF